MSKSTRLASATYILSCVAANAPDLVTTDEVARRIEDHPARVRQLVAALVKAGLVESVRGANGGIKLARRADQIDLSQIYAAVADQPIVSIAWKKPIPKWANMCRVQPNFERLHDAIQERALAELGKYRLSDMFTKLAAAAPRGPLRGDP